MLRNVFLPLLAVIALQSCVSPPAVTTPAPQEIFVKAAAEQTWNALIADLTALRVNVESMDKAGWFLRSEEIKIEKGNAVEYVDCGTVLGRPLAQGLDVTMRFTFLLRPQGDSTALRVQSTAKGWDADQAALRAKGSAFAENPDRTCVSKGAFERKMIAKLLAR
jgi:hypothetical protein